MKSGVSPRRLDPPSLVTQSHYCIPEGLSEDMDWYGPRESAHRRRRGWRYIELEDLVETLLIVAHLPNHDRPRFERYSAQLFFRSGRSANPAVPDERRPLVRVDLDRQVPSADIDSGRARTYAAGTRRRRCSSAISPGKTGKALRLGLNVRPVPVEPWSARRPDSVT